MKIIVVHYFIGVQERRVEFSDTVSGNNKSIKFIQGLYAERKKNGWYYKLVKLEKLKADFENARGKKKYQIESQIQQEEIDRAEVLELLGIDGPPERLKVEIYKKEK